ncbi:origin of replication complex subunit 5 [Tanacetum coccineum]|uniref:Origin of replication complex subunit 5 n=1 Tax=Tanacetum coccineum TaxID=301880 RepID=A0ABQ4ZB67_9ASTR
MLHRRNVGNGYSSIKKCEKAADFVNLLKEGLSSVVEGLDGNMVYLVFDSLELVKDWDKSCTIFPLLFRLNDVLKVDGVGLVFVSGASIDTYHLDTGFVDPVPVYFPDYTEEDLRQIFMRNQSNLKLRSAFLENYTPEVSNQKRRGGHWVSFAYADLITTIMRITGKIVTNMFMSAQCLLDWLTSGPYDPKLFCTHLSFGFETTQDYPYEGVARALLKDWSELKFDEKPRYTIDEFNCFYGKRIKPALRASFTSTGFPCIANISSKMLKRHCSAKELSTLCADLVVLIVGLDLSSKNEADHTVEIKNSWGKNWARMGSPGLHGKANAVTPSPLLVRNFGSIVYA